MAEPPLMFHNCSPKFDASAIRAVANAPGARSSPTSRLHHLAPYGDEDDDVEVVRGRGLSNSFASFKSVARQ